MGFLSAYSGTERIDVGDGYYIEVKTCLNVIEKQRAEKALSANPVIDMNGRGTARLDMTAFHNEMMAASVVGWNLDDEDGTVWALAPDSVKRANIARLPSPVFDQVWQAVDRLNGPRERQEQVRFPDVDDDGDQVGDAGPAEPGDVQP